jgi:galactose-1-phosphate uridylyltransferase
MGFHQRPIPYHAGSGVSEEEDEHSVAHLHLHFYPPLLRSATIRKFLVGSVHYRFVTCASSMTKFLVSSLWLKLKEI